MMSSEHDRVKPITAERLNPRNRRGGLDRSQRTILAQEIGMPVDLALGLDAVTLAFTAATLLDRVDRVDQAVPLPLLERMVAVAVHEVPVTVQTTLCEVFGLLVDLEERRPLDAADGPQRIGRARDREN
jgi:hypothetical protein